MSKKKSEKEAKPKKQSAKKSVVKPVSEPVTPKEAGVMELKESKPKAKKPKAAPLKNATAAISGEDVALRAYFIAERRAKMGWHGDSTSDWVEAERQLKAEAARKK